MIAKQQHLLWQKAALLFKPGKRQTPSEWAAENRKYPLSAAIPGPRDPSLTPYVIAVSDAVQRADKRRVVMVCGSQMGKTDSALDLIGWNLDRINAVPTIFAGPSLDFVSNQFEPRVMALLDEAPTLKRKVARGKRNKKTRKIISGVPLRLAHAGSSTSLKSDPAGLALTDEYDEMLANVKGQGDPLGLIDARGDTYQDFVNLITSTPSVGVSDVERDHKSGLELWKYQKPEDITSPIWRLWQEGTRYHWAAPCPECYEYFIPRFKQLRWKKNATPAEARKAAYLECPRCGGVMEEQHKTDVNASSVYVAPGQWVTKLGEVLGDAPEADSYSFWVSGLMSPFRSFGDRAASYITASTMQDQEKIQTAINAGFGELFSAGGGEVMEWQAAAERRDDDLATDEVPESAAVLTCGVDVQGDRLVYTIRAWGFRYTSWLIRHEELWGDPDQDEVWDELETVISNKVDGRRINLTLIDAGYKQARVLEFAKRMGKLVRATKGQDTGSKPFHKAMIDVTVRGKVVKNGQSLWHINTDFFKTFVHGRLNRDLRKPGGWHVPAEADDEYFKQLVSERRITTPSGKPKWQQIRSDNHYFDCEVLNSVAAHMLKVGRLREGHRAPAPTHDETQEQPAKKKPTLAELSARLNG